MISLIVILIGLIIYLLHVVNVAKKRKKMPRPVRKWIVRLRMWYADLRGHHGKKWNYEPSKNYMRKK